MPRPIALLADIHGNEPALNAVLTHARSRDAELILNLGDIFFGPLFPGRTLERLLNIDFAPVVTVLGNQDRILLESETPSTTTLSHTRNELRRNGLDYLRALPPLETVSHGPTDILLCHGSPDTDMDYLLEDVSQGVPAPRSPQAVATALRHTDHAVVCCGHTHMPRICVADGRLVVNPGSVGLQAYEDDTPPHAMQAGSPHARYALLHDDGDGFSVEHVAVKYDWEFAARTALDNGCPDWARWLATGRA